MKPKKIRVHFEDKDRSLKYVDVQPSECSNYGEIINVSATTVNHERKALIGKFVLINDLQAGIAFKYFDVRHKSIILDSGEVIKGSEVSPFLGVRCTKCNEVIPMGAGYYNYTSGVQCSPCGAKMAPLVEKALNAELLVMAEELKQNGSLK